MNCKNFYFYRGRSFLSVVLLLFGILFFVRPAFSLYKAELTNIVYLSNVSVLTDVEKLTNVSENITNISLLTNVSIVTDSTFLTNITGKSTNIEELKIFIVRTNITITEYNVFESEDIIVTGVSGIVRMEKIADNKKPHVKRKYNFLISSKLIFSKDIKKEDIILQYSRFIKDLKLFIEYYDINGSEEDAYFKADIEDV
ncbi:MAG: hypothetical protein KAS39_00920, partial [Actinomycetia bacterium]|nr:hypothetical protein [Actinomycetes bacterium]